MLSQKMSIKRLRFYERECRRSRNDAQDPLTQRELAALEQTFRQLAADIEAAQSGAPAS